jgi:hypothetical protein
MTLRTFAPGTFAPSLLRTFALSNLRTFDHEGGLALIVSLMMLSILSALGLGLSLIVSSDPRAAANQREGAAAEYVARAGLELAVRELTTTPAWDAWLSGAATSSLVDGAASGTRTLPSGDTIDIGRLTNQLTCGRDAACTDAQADAVTRDRPWGANNPRWRPFIYGSTSALGLTTLSDRHYLLVFVGDDGAERDGRPDMDGPDEAGGGIVRLSSHAFGPFHSRQSLEARVSRRCEALEGVRSCEAGLRVLSVR